MCNMHIHIAIFDPEVDRLVTFKSEENFDHNSINSHVERLRESYLKMRVQNYTKEDFYHLIKATNYKGIKKVNSHEYNQSQSISNAE